MSQEEQGKKTSPVISDAVVKDLVIPAEPVGDLSEQELAGVAGGIQFTIGDVETAAALSRAPVTPRGAR